jgi:HEAT repeat protein
MEKAGPIKEGLNMSEKRLKAVADLVAKIGDKDDKVRAEARDNAGEVGAPAVNVLAGVMTDPDFEVARAAKRALWKIVRHAGRPGADGERKPVVAELIALLGEKRDVPVRREAMWMLSEISGDEAVDPVAALLSDKELREDARMVLERLPGEESLAALRKALRAVPPEFKINIAQSLRARGVKVRGFPCRKLVPTRKTSLKPVG